jgi:multidrug efflux pump subunit AcrA (membrane-fusion protein)
VKVAHFVQAASLVCVGVAAGWLIRSWKGPTGESEETAEESATKPEDMSVEVVTQEAKKGELHVTLAAIGVARADEGAIVSLGSRAGGRVAEVFVKTGEDVKAGARILRYDEAPLALAVAQAQAALATASNQLDQFERADRAKQDADLAAAAAKAASDEESAARQFARQSDLLASGLAAPRAVDDARAALQKAKLDHASADLALSSFRNVGGDLQHAGLVAARDVAAAALADAKAVLAQATVTAPVDGRVLALSTHLGDRVDVGAVVGTLLRGEGRILVFGVTPAQAVGICPGAHVTWTDATGAGREASVRSVAGDVTGGTGLVEIVAAPAGDAPPPGLVVRGEIETGALSGVVLVPLRAIVRAEDEPSVVVIGAGGVSKRVRIEVLGRHGDVAAVKGDVKGGDRVAVEGGYNLPDGARTHEGGDKVAADGKPHAKDPPEDDEK